MYFLTSEDMAESDIQFVRRSGVGSSQASLHPAGKNVALAPAHAETRQADALAAIPGSGLAQCRQLRAWQGGGMQGQAPAGAVACFKWLEIALDRHCTPTRKPSLNAVMNDLLTSRGHPSAARPSDADILRVTLVGLGCKQDFKSDAAFAH